MLGEILGAGATLLSGLFGSSAEKDAAEENRAIAEMNLKWQKEQFNKMLEIALRQEAEGKLGYTDANGNRVHYVEGKGWVTELSPAQQLLQEYYRGEERRQLQQDIPAKREQMFANLAAQRGEGQYADALLTQMKNLSYQPAQDVENTRNLLSAEGINEGYDKTLEAMLLRAGRTGGDTGAIAADIGRARGADLRKAFLENQQGAQDEAYNRYATKVGNLANLYNTFRTRASATPNVEYNPRNIEGSTQQLLTGAAGAGQQAGANLLNANNVANTPTLKYEAPVQYGMANTLASLGRSLGNIDFSGMNFGGNYGGSSTADRYGPWGDSRSYY